MRIKVAVDDLQNGMYVSDLDRPWLESPFLLQGLLLKEHDDIQKLKEICAYVYVDASRSTCSISPDLLKNSGQISKPKQDFINTVVISKDEVETAGFAKQAEKASLLREKTYEYIQQTFNQVYNNQNVDVDTAKEVVSALVSNILAGNDAMIWLTHLKNRDEYTAIHSLNVCIYSISFGRFLGLSEQEINILGLGALLLDVGKLKVPETILKKPGKLTNEQFILMKAHTFIGYELLKNNKNMPPEALDIVLSHHERLGGQGYPNGKREEEISYFARIVAIIDVYDALTSDKPYNDGLTPRVALNKLYDLAPNNFSQDLIESFIKFMGIYPIGSVVELNTGHTAIVIANNDNNHLKPIVGLLLNRKQEPYQTIRLLNLSSSVWHKGKSHEVIITKILEHNAYDIDIQSVVSKVLTTHGLG
jgi:HD-GYP domain-containing protein (c-di-GMP phosphodiesterase class II)